MTSLEAAQLTAMSHPLNTPLGRFGIVTSEEGPHRCVASIPAGGMINPLTGAPTIAPLVMLVDHIGGLVNHHRRTPDEWTVSSELSVEVAPDAFALIAAAPGIPVVATGRPFGQKGSAPLGRCELTHRGAVLATATVRSFHIKAPGEFTGWPDRPSDLTPRTDLADKMAVRVAESGGQAKVLVQLPDPVLNNTLGIVHGGVSAMALELVASAAVNAGRGGQPLNTASVRVNFMRQFRSDPESHYVGTPLHVGRSSGIADARAVGDDGEVAILARVTAYR
jgi:uncharacterized protein (TIGR00369 family)